MGDENTNNKTSNRDSGSNMGLESLDNSGENQPENRLDTGRNPDGTFVKGESGNPGGRPRGGLKDYDRQRFIDMSDEEKEKFLKTISPELRYKMAEGNPPQVVEGNKDKPLIINIAKEIAEQNDITQDTIDNSTEQSEV